MAIADGCMTCRSLSKNSKADLPSGTTSVMIATGYSGFFCPLGLPRPGDPARRLGQALAGSVYQPR